jgi:Hint domain
MNPITGPVVGTVTIGTAGYYSPLTIDPGGSVTATNYGGAVNTAVSSAVLYNHGYITGGATASSTNGGYGVALPASSVSNYSHIFGGTTTSSGNGGTGVLLVNGTLTKNTGIIAGGESFGGSGNGGTGVYLSGGTPANNGGGITGGKTLNGATGDGGTGLDLIKAATLTNNGSITGGTVYGSSIGVGGAGVVASGVNTYLTNNNSIFGGASTGTGLGTDGGGTGVYLSGRAKLSNLSKIEGGSGKTYGGVGLIVSGSRTQATNEDIISGGAGSVNGSGGAGAELTQGNLSNTAFVVGGNGAGTGAGGVGVDIEGGDLTTLSGSIEGGTGPAGGTGGVGVVLNGGFLDTATGISGGYGAASTGVQADAVLFGSKGGQLTVGSGATFGGDIGGFNGSSAIYMQGLTPTQVASDFGVTPIFMGDGRYEFDGSAGGETLTTTPSQNEGTLDLMGNFSADHFILAAYGSNGTYIELAPGPVCYLRGTRILTPTGEVLIETLKRGDCVVTRFGGLQRIKWIGRQSYRAAAVRENREHIPVHLRAGCLGENLPARDLYVSPGHSMLIEDTLVLATSLVNGITITQNECPERIDYFQIELTGHDCVIAEGTWSETYADWEEGRKLFHNAAEFHALFPDHHAPEDPILCAPRPERGAPLDTVLRPIVARAARDVSPGPLAGFIDQVRGDWKLDGWAHDEAHPELPVLLEILLEGNVIGTVLACDYREDLLKAGFGQGRCSFTFVSPVKLRPALLSTLQVRRAVDGAMVRVSKAILDAALEPAIAKPRLTIAA